MPRVELVVGEHNPLYAVIRDALTEDRVVRPSHEPPPDVTMTLSIAGVNVEYRLQGRPQVEWYGNGMVMVTTWRAEVEGPGEVASLG